MQQIIYFFQKFKYFLFFVLLEFIALTFIFNNHNFHQSKFVSSANSISAFLYSKTSNISDYFSLRAVNNQLLEENNNLKNQLEKKYHFSSVDSIIVDSLKYHQKYTYTRVKIINNNYSKKFNFLTINKGSNQEITKEMAVVNDKGILGITENTTQNYTRVQSILNKDSKINARVKGNTFHFGTLKWDGKNYSIVQLHDIPRQAPLQIGDTIETGGKSTIFPEGIPIGIILKTNQGNTINNKIDIQLFNDMSNIKHAYVIKNLHKKEIQLLENNSNE